MTYWDLSDKVTLIVDTIADQVDDAARREYHANACGCDKGIECKAYQKASWATAEDTLTWLIEQNLIHPDVLKLWISANLSE